MTPQQSTLNSFLDSQTLQSDSKGPIKRLHEVRDHCSKMTQRADPTVNARDEFRLLLSVQITLK